MPVEKRPLVVGAGATRRYIGRYQMALQTVGHPDRRAYNPDRDMLWALHRFFRWAFVQLGDGSNEKLAELMKAHGINVPHCDLAENLKEFIKEVVAVTADPILQETKDPGALGEELLMKLFRADNDGHTSIRTLFCVMFFKGVVCELPLWAAHTRPKHPNDPMPGNKEIETAAREFLGRLESTGEIAGDC